MYDCQTQSKKNRQLDKTLGIYFKIDCVFEEINKKHFKNTTQVNQLKDI